MNKPQRSVRLPVVIGLVLGAITVLLFLPSVRHGFLDFDDQQYVTENPVVRAGLTGRGIAWAFGFHAGNWHPLAWLSHLLDSSLYGLKPAGHHLTNVLLHSANTVLLFLALFRFTGLPWRCAAVAAMFGWHPLHVESVAWVAERKDVLCAFFWMLTMLAYGEYVTAAKSRSALARLWYVAALGVFALSLMSKPMAVTLPFVLLLLDGWPLGRFQSSDGGTVWRTARSLLVEKLPFLALAAGTCALTLLAQEAAIVPTEGLSVAQRLAHACVAYSHYLGAMIVPRGLAVFYPYPPVLPIGKIAVAVIILAILSFAAFGSVRRHPWLAFGWCWYLGTLVPVIGLVQVGDQAWADRYTYLPLVGLFIAVVWSAVEWIKHRRLLLSLAVALSLAMLAATSAQLRHWKSTRTLFEHTARVTKANHMAITMLGSLLAREGKLGEATMYYHQALRLRPGFAEAHFFLGNALDQQGRLEEAIAEYRRALRFKPYLEQTHILLGIALGKQRDFINATAHLQAALKINPESAVAHNNLARLRHTEGRLDAAVEHYTAALRLDPQLAQAHNNLGIVLVQQGRLAEGAVRLREALRLNPTNAETQLNLAMALNQQDQWAEAIKWFEQVIHPGFAEPNALTQYARALAQQQRTREAMSRYAQVLLAQPEFVDALDGLAWILATAAQPEFREGTEAVRMAESACRLTNRGDTGKLKTLAAAYAEAQRFTEAISVATEARDLSVRSSNTNLTRDCEALLEKFKSSQPWREAR